MRRLSLREKHFDTVIRMRQARRRLGFRDAIAEEHPSVRISERKLRSRASRYRFGFGSMLVHQSDRWLAFRRLFLCRRISLGRFVFRRLLLGFFGNGSIHNRFGSLRHEQKRAYAHNRRHADKRTGNNQRRSLARFRTTRNIAGRLAFIGCRLYAVPQNFRAFGRRSTGIGLLHGSAAFRAKCVPFVKRSATTCAKHLPPLSSPWLQKPSTKARPSRPSPILPLLALSRFETPGAPTPPEAGGP